MKKILFYIHSLNKGGAERVLLAVADELNRRSEYEVVILTDTVDELEYEIPAGLRRVILEDRMARESAGCRLQAVRAFVREYKPDRFVVFMLSSAIRAVLSTIGTGYKVIAAVRSNPYDDYSGGRNRALLLMTMGLTEKIICQTGYQVDFFPMRLKKKCVVISNPIFRDFELKAKTITYDKKGGEEVCQAGYEESAVSGKIVATGRLFDYKNHSLLIRAFGELAEKFPKVNVVIYGEGPYRRTLEKEIDDAGLVGRVFLPGDSKDVAGDIEDALLYVLPSDTEGLPNALMEAMALGLPVIATDCPCGGPRSLIQDRVNGILTPVGDTQAMKAAMEELLTDVKLRTSIAIKAGNIRKTNSIDVIMDKWCEIL